MLSLSPLILHVNVKINLSHPVVQFRTIPFKTHPHLQTHPYQSGLPKVQAILP